MNEIGQTEEFVQWFDKLRDQRVSKLIAIKRYGIALEDMVRERERLVIRRPDILKYMDRIIVKSYEVSFAKA